MQLARAHSQGSFRETVTTDDALVAILLVEESLVRGDQGREGSTAAGPGQKRALTSLARQTARYGYSILNFEAPAPPMARSNLDHYPGATLDAQMAAFGAHVARVCDAAPS